MCPDVQISNESCCGLPLVGKFTLRILCGNKKNVHFKMKYFHAVPTSFDPLIDLKKKACYGILHIFEHLKFKPSSTLFIIMLLETKALSYYYQKSSLPNTHLVHS